MTLNLALSALILAVLLGAAATQAPCASAADAPLKAGDIDPKNGKKIKYWVAPMDPTYIRNEPGKSPMGMDLVPVYDEGGGEKEPTSTIRIDPVTMQNMGVRLGRAEKKELVKKIRTLGTVTYDESLIYTVNTKFNGWIEKLYVKFEGESVKAGQPLFDIYSPELVSAQEEYLLAVRQNKQLASSSIPGVAANAQRLLEASRTRLQFWDFTKAQIRALTQSMRVRKNVTVYSPATGVVIKKNAFDGHYVKAGEHQYEIADLSRVWVDVEIYEYELPFVHEGMPAEMELSYLPDQRFSGRVLFIYPFLSAKTRTARLRLEFANPNMLLKPNMYANVFLESAVKGLSIVIPQEAVIHSGERTLVFLSRGQGKFEPREIKLGVEGADETVQVLSGLSAGDEIVLSAQFLLDSESRLREAIQKMLEIRNAPSEQNTNDLKMDDLKMDDLKMDDMDMSDLKMQ